MNPQNNWIRHLRRGQIVLLDGGLATELERNGADLDHPLWSGQILRTQPDLIRNCHDAYFRAGASIATTASYQLTPEGMRRAGLNPRDFADLIALSVELARDSASMGDVIAGSVGPYGAMLNDGSEYTGKYDIDADHLRRFHLPRIEQLLAAGVDVIAFETFPSPAEAKVVASIMQSFEPVPCWVSFTCQDATHTGCGDNLLEAAAMLEQYPQVSAIGVNCVSPEIAIEATKKLSQSIAVPIVAYPNSGEHFHAASNLWKDARSAMSAAAIGGGLAEAGAQVIGGCCRTTPDWIDKVRGTLMAH